MTVPTEPQNPTLATFLDAPITEVMAVAPQTVIVGANSAQLTAAYAGIEPNSQEYAVLAHQQLLACIELLFRCGVQHVIPFIMNGELQADARYRAHFIRWVEHGTSGPEILSAYASHGWRARLAGVESLPELAPAAERLIAATPAQWTQTLWWSVAAQRAKETTQAALIRSLYGEEIPPASMFLGFGKPFINPSFIPLPLIGDMQCYWPQRPGFGVDESMLRRMIYDYAYVRRTRTSGDRSGRYALLQEQRAAWETDAVLGVGQHLGGFWYPAPFPAVNRSSDDES
jgi:hypothetical protein